MNTLSVRRGASLPLQVVSDDKDVISVTLIIKEYPTDLSTVFSKQAEFVDGVANLTLTPDDTMLPIGKYVYQLTVIAPNDTVEKYPETSDCDDDCSFPVFEVRAALDAVRD